jgi:hypothetical protein
MHELRLADAAIATDPNVVVANIVGTVAASDLVAVCQHGQSGCPFKGQRYNVMFGDAETA